MNAECALMDTSELKRNRRGIYGALGIISCITIALWICNKVKTKKNSLARKRSIYAWHHQLDLYRQQEARKIDFKYPDIEKKPREIRKKSTVKNGETSFSAPLSPASSILSAKSPTAAYFKIISPLRQKS